MLMNLLLPGAEPPKIAPPRNSNENLNEKQKKFCGVEMYE